MSSNNVNLHFGVIIPGSALTQTAGDAQFKNIHLYRISGESKITSLLSCEQDIICSRSVSGTSFISTSDSSIKDYVKNASSDDCKSIFYNVDVKTYIRKDMTGTRIGFIAQDIKANLPIEFDNIVSTSNSLLAVDYSRMVCVLWGVVKNLQERINTLESSKKTTKKSCKKTV